MWQILIKTKQDHLEKISAVIEEDCVTTSWVEIEDKNAQWDSEDWFIEGHMLECPNNEELRLKIILAAHVLGIEEPHITIQPLEETDWLQEMWEKFPPQSVGPFFIHGTQFKGAIPTDKIAIALDAATAFGSGEHATTAGCMLALDAISKEFQWKKPLDLGCGSGILAIAACKLNPIFTLAIDNDSEAVRVTEQNAVLNHVDDYVRAQCGNGLDGINDSFDLIVANILAGPLIQLAPKIYEHLQNEGYVILSGLLDWQEQDVMKAYTNQGFKLHEIHTIDRWVTLVLNKAK